MADWFVDSAGIAAAQKFIDEVQEVIWGPEKAEVAAPVETASEATALPPAAADGIATAADGLELAIAKMGSGAALGRSVGVSQPVINRPNSCTKSTSDWWAVRKLA